MKSVFAFENPRFRYFPLGEMWGIQIIDYQQEMPF